MIVIEIRCDHEDTPGARDARAPCSSRDNASPVGQHRDHTTALAHARTAARHDGWHNVPINNARQRGWLCPNCRARQIEN